MTKKNIVYTALFGNYDHLLEPKNVDDECDYICVTDNHELKSETWQIQYVSNDSGSIAMNRMYKMMPHRFFSSYEYALYVDANVQLLNGPSEIIRHYMSKSSIAFPKHFKHDCIYDEATFCRKSNKITEEELNKITTELLLAENFPRHIGLAENNILIRDLGDHKLQTVMEDWWVIFNKYASRDQLSLMYLLWKNNVNYSFMSESSRNNNAYFSYALHEHLKSGNYFKNKLLLMSAMRDKNILNEIVAKILDRL